MTIPSYVYLALFSVALLFGFLNDISENRYSKFLLYSMFGSWVFIFVIGCLVSADDFYLEGQKDALKGINNTKMITTMQNNVVFKTDTVLLDTLSTTKNTNTTINKELVVQFKNAYFTVVCKNDTLDCTELLNFIK